MHCEFKMDEDLYYIGSSDRRIHLFENVYPLSNGVSYNSYLYLDEKTVLLDTVDESVSKVFYENIEYLLNGRKLDYLIVNHMEPDHAANIGEVLLRYPDVTVVVNANSKKFLLNYFPDCKAKFLIVKEGDTLNTGKRTFTFVMAPMVHWPEVMFTYETTGKVLYSADAFGTFGAVSGNIYADVASWDKLYLEEARRYYTNIVGKYGPQVVNVLKKAATIDIAMICPLHGPIYRDNLNVIISKYVNWATYTPEDPDGVMIAYSSVYGDTANAAEILARDLALKGIKKIAVYDVSKTDSSYLIAEAFRVKTIVLAATTYNMGVFVKMEDFLHDLANHKIKNRTIAFVQNGSWAPNATKCMKDILSDLEGMNYIEKEITINSALKRNQMEELDILASAIVSTIAPKDNGETIRSLLDPSAVFKLTYGLFVVTTKDKNGFDNGSINNSFWQVADNPQRVLLSVNKKNLTHDTIKETGVFNVSVLTEEVKFDLFKRFGFQTGRNANKFEGTKEENFARSENGLYYLKKYSNAYISAKVVETIDCGSHTLFVCELVESKTLSNANSLTYAYYFANIKPKPVPEEKKKEGWVCKICGYFKEGRDLPPDFICPLCKHGASDFEKVGF
ncbi:MAG: flavin reductase [Bacilli bacterium]|nr:flavin reductase [Bacilli bacterium]